MYVIITLLCMYRISNLGDSSEDCINNLESMWKPPRCRWNQLPPHVALTAYVSNHLCKFSWNALKRLWNENVSDHSQNLQLTTLEWMRDEIFEGSQINSMFWFMYNFNSGRTTYSTFNYPPAPKIPSSSSSVPYFLVVMEMVDTSPIYISI